MAKPKPTLLDEVLAMPDSSKASFEGKLTASGRKGEVDALIDAYESGKLASKFVSRHGVGEFIKEKLGITFCKDSFRKYVESRHGKNSNR
jgi:hypothetical protein